jgi:hypothetical protein
MHMNNFSAPRALRMFAGGALLLCATLAQAQYVWVDAKGIKQFSDRPPPPSTPQSKILKAPGQQPLSRADGAQSIDAMTNPAPAAAPAAASAPAKKAPPTVAEQNAEFKKRATEKAEAEKKLAIEAEQRRVKLENCESARKHKAQLDSGERITEKDATGERTFITEAQRLERQEKARKALEACN